MDRQENSVDSCKYTARKDDPSNWHGEEPSDWILDKESPLGIGKEIWECPHSALDDQEYCVFHTDPSHVPDEINEVDVFIKLINEDSKNVDEETARRKKEFIGAKFGEFRINNTILSSEDRYPIRLEHATFTDGICIEDSSVEQDFLCSGTHFITNHISNTNNDGKVSFEDTVFNANSICSFLNAEFSGDGDVFFNNSKFYGESMNLFNGVTFSGGGKVLFENSTFSSYGLNTFSEAEFTGDIISFEETIFNKSGNVLFQDTKFNASRVTFESSQINTDGTLSFDGTVFNGDSISFKNITVNVDDDILFSEIDLIANETIIFEKSHLIGDYISFNNSLLSGDEKISFADLECSASTRINFSSSEFNGGELVFWLMELSAEGVQFRDAKFIGESATFYDIEIIGDRISFTKSKFSVDIIISFHQSKFVAQRDMHFMGAEFTNDADVKFTSVDFIGDCGPTFMSTKFKGNGTISFDDSLFEKNTSFREIEVDIDSVLSFKNSTFKSNVKFEPPTDKSYTYAFNFSGATFHMIPDFSNHSSSKEMYSESGKEEDKFSIIFEKDIDFTNTTFLDGVDFTNTFFASKVDFTSAILNDSDFSNSYIYGGDNFPEKYLVTNHNKDDGSCFKNTDLNHSKIRNADFSGVNMKDASLRACDLENTSFSGANLREATLVSADCEASKFEHTVLIRASFVDADLIQANLSGAYLFGTKLNGAQISSETQVGQDGSIGDNIKTSYCRYDTLSSPDGATASLGIEDNNGESIEIIRFRQARSVYRRLEEVARENGFPDLQSAMFVRRQDMRRQLLREQGKRSKRWFVEIQRWVMGYGESFTRILATSSIIVIVSWLLFALGGIIDTSDERSIDIGLISEEPVLIWETFHHSVLLFFTGNSLFSPNGIVGQAVITIEAILGPILLALLIFVLGRQAAR